MKNSEQRTLPNIELENELRQLWLGFWGRVRTTGDPQQYFDDIVQRYSEDQRVYHTLQHIVHCLQEFDEVRSLARNPNAVEMAIWFHDIIYERGKDDEERSAAHAQQVATTIGLPVEFGNEVARLILTTKHTFVPEDIDAKLLGDIDISILGQAPETFNRYEDNIRREYSFVEDEPFRRGRTAVIQSFLDRESIFATDYFKTKYNNQAESNLVRSLQRWKSLEK